MARKKEKIIWVDDGRTIADMTGIGRRGYVPPRNEPKAHGGTSGSKPLKYHAPLKEQLRTFFDAMGLMILPTLAIIGLLLVLFLIMYIIL